MRSGAREPTLAIFAHLSWSGFFLSSIMGAWPCILSLPPQSKSQKLISPKHSVTLDCISLQGKLSTAEEAIDLVLQPSQTDADQVTGSLIPGPGEREAINGLSVLKRLIL